MTTEAKSNFDDVISDLEWIISINETADFAPIPQIEAAIAALREYPKVREELEEANASCELMSVSIGDAEAETERLRENQAEINAGATKKVAHLIAIAREAEAKLEKFRPLIEAAGRVDKVFDTETIDLTMTRGAWNDVKSYERIRALLEAIPEEK
jgi:hypothetical protein